MKHMTRSYPPENAMLRPHKESALEKAQNKRKSKLPATELDEDGGVLNKQANDRMKRKRLLHDALNKIHDPDIA